MLNLTRINDVAFMLNPDMVVTIESTPDTIILLTTGERLVVKESVEAIQQQFIQLKQAFYQNKL